MPTTASRAPPIAIAAGPAGTSVMVGVRPEHLYPVDGADAIVAGPVEMVEQLGAIPNPFESWWWVNRKPLVIGGVVLLGLGAIALVATAVK